MAVTLNGSVLTQQALIGTQPRTLTWTSAVLTAGDIVIIEVLCNGAVEFSSPAAPTGGTGLSWTIVKDQQNTAAHFSRAIAYWSKIPSDQTSTLTQVTSGTGSNQHSTQGTLKRWSGADQVTPIGQTAGFQGQTDPTGTALQILGTLAGSAIGMAASDWSAGTAARTISISGTTGGVTDLDNLESGQFRAISARGAQSSSTNQGTLDYTAATGDWAAILYEIEAAPSAGGAAFFRPGRTWQRRYKHRQRLPTVGVVAVVGDFTADVSATVTATDTVTAVVGKIGAVTATVTAGGTVTAAVRAVGAVSATVTCGSTVTAVVGAVGAVSATIVCGSTVTGSTVSGLIGTVNVTVTAGSTVTAVVGKVGTVNVTVTSGVTTAAITALFGAVVSTITSGSTVAAVRAITNAAVTGTVTTTSTVTPFLLGAVIDANGRVTVSQTVTSTVDVSSAPISQAGIDQTFASAVSGSSAAGGITSVDTTSDGRASVG